MIDFLTDFTGEPTREIVRETMDNVVSPQVPQWEDIERERQQWIAEWEAETVTEVNPFPMTLGCGHPSALAVYSAETEQLLFCDLCDCRSRRNDAEKMEAELRAENAQLRKERDAALAKLLTAENAAQAFAQCSPGPGLHYDGTILPNPEYAASITCKRCGKIEAAKHGVDTANPCRCPRLVDERPTSGQSERGPGDKEGR